MAQRTSGSGVEAALAQRDERGAAAAEYAAVTAAGVGIAGILISIITSDFGRMLLERIIEFFLGMVGVA